MSDQKRSDLLVNIAERKHLYLFYLFYIYLYVCSVHLNKIVLVTSIIKKQ